MAVWVKKHRANIASSTLRVSWGLFVGGVDWRHSFTHSAMRRVEMLRGVLRERCQKSIEACLCTKVKSSGF